MVDTSQKISNSQTAAPTPAGVPEPDAEQLRQILNSAEGQSLLRLLQADGGAGLRTASTALRQGNLEGVKAALSPLLAGTEAETLARRLEGRL